MATVRMPQVPHVRQAFNWDCGLACVLMVLQAAAPKAAGMDLATLRQYCPTTRYALQSSCNIMLSLFCKSCRAGSLCHSLVLSTPTAVVL